jgi:hypothetical protein
MQDDPNRPISPHPADDPYVRRPVEREGMGWGIPLGFAAVIVLIAGLFFFSSGGERTTTASNTPTTTQSTSAPDAQSTPSAEIGRTAPPPAKTQ